MRHLFIVFLIALLPLRSWVSDAMATEMMVIQVQTQQHLGLNPIADHVNDTGEKSHIYALTIEAKTGSIAADCSDHASGEDSHAADTHCGSCSACQVCHTLALFAAPAEVPAVFSLGLLPRAELAQFASVPAARGQKPPIS